MEWLLAHLSVLSSVVCPSEYVKKMVTVDLHRKGEHDFLMSSYVPASSEHGLLTTLYNKTKSEPSAWVEISGLMFKSVYTIWFPGIKGVWDIDGKEERPKCRQISLSSTSHCCFYSSPYTGSSYKLMCWYNNVAKDRPGGGRFSPADIDPCLCTHLIYAFAQIQNNRIVPGRGEYTSMGQSSRPGGLVSSECWGTGENQFV